MLPQHFLQKHQIGAGAAHRLAQLRKNEAPIEGGEALVSVDGQHPQALDARRVGLKGAIAAHAGSCESVAVTDGTDGRRSRSAECATAPVYIRMIS